MLKFWRAEYSGQFFAIQYYFLSVCQILVKFGQTINMGAFAPKIADKVSLVIWISLSIIGQYRFIPFKKQFMKDVTKPLKNTITLKESDKEHDTYCGIFLKKPKQSTILKYVLISRSIIYISRLFYHNLEAGVSKH